MSDLLHQLHQLYQPQPEHLPQIRPQASHTLSELQLEFNRLIRHINTLKAKLSERTDARHQIQQRVQKEIQPLIAQIIRLRVELVQWLDQVFVQDLFARHEQEKLAAFIWQMTAHLLHHYDAEELTELHQQYAAYVQAHPAEPPQAPGPTPETELPHTATEPEPEEAWEDWEQKQARLEAEREADRKARQAQRAAGKKNKVQPLAEKEKLKLELSQLSKASRRVYTNLAKLLHPDKELDPAKRPWKEEAMKKVTLAYHQNDFYELLRLQMEFLQEEEHHLTQIPEEQLRFYVQLLQEQLEELETEQRQAVASHGEEGFYAQFNGTPKQTERKFREIKKDLKEEIRQLEFESSYLRDAQHVRELLKQL